MVGRARKYRKTQWFWHIFPPRGSLGLLPWIGPKWLPDCSQMPPRLLPDCFQIAPRLLLDSLPKQSLPLRVPGGFSSGLVRAPPGQSELRALAQTLEITSQSQCHLRHSAAKCSVASSNAVKHNTKSTFLLQITSWPQLGSKSSQRAARRA